MKDIGIKTDCSYVMEMFFDLSPDLLCVAGYDGFFRKINPAVLDLLEYSQEELMSRPISDFIHPDDRSVTASVRKDLIRNKPLYNFDNRYITKSGKVVWLSWTSYPVEAEGLVFAIAKNITQRKRLEEERNNLIHDLTKLNKDLKLLSYTTTHDLRSPINNLLTTFSLLDISKIKDPETVSFIELLHSSTQSLKETINTYVDVINRKQESILVEELNVEEVLNEVIQSIIALIKDSRTTLHINFAVAKIARFNRAYLQSIFLNLLTNSIKYAKPGVAPVIHVSTRMIDGRIQIVVEDNGSGFDLDNVNEKVFGLHQKFHNHADSKGVGLYLVHNYVTSLGGKIDLKSAPHQGATFTITLAG